jgi:porphobilinogen synthase
MFPIHRPRRLRQHPQIRRMVQENLVTTADLIYPLFAVPGDQIAQEVSSMPGVYQLSVDKIVEEAKEVYDLGIPAIILFGIPEDKDTEATGAWHDCGIVQKATTAVKEAVPDLVVIVDTCLCEYTSHGHCGYLDVGDLTGRVLNDPTLELLKKTAVSQARAGADIIAPSGMMDGFVQAIRTGWMTMDLNRFPFCPMPLSMPRPTTALSEMQQIQLLNLATAVLIKWTRLMVLRL